MSVLEFTRNDKPTLGVEIELQLIDADTMELKNCIGDVLGALPESLREHVKPEIMQSYIEVNTEVCQTVSDVERALHTKLQGIEPALEQCNVRLGWGGTHPFSPWYEQKTTPNERYLRLLENLRDTARRLVSFGLHVHVGVDTGDKAVMICDRMLRYLPILLALSTNSPFWNGRNTGLHSQRSKVLEGLPTAGLPPLMRNWSEYVWLINHLVETQFIETIREIWWDLRPHHNFGTVEVRICDMPYNLDSVLALAALIQCLVHDLSIQIDEGMYQFDCHPMMVRQNKWRATRFGMDAVLVDPYSMEVKPVAELVTDLLPKLKDHAKTLKCEDHLELIRKILTDSTGSKRQLCVYESTHDLREVTRSLLWNAGSESRLVPTTGDAPSKTGADRSTL